MISDETIALAVERLSRAAGEDARILLFGSQARGEAGEGSDLDFLVIQREVGDRHAEAVRLRRALRGLGIPIDIIVTSEAHLAEWGEVHGTVLSAALREGVPVDGD